MTLPLENVRIVDFTIMMQGPHATQMLADMGAEVIKVERRTVPPAVAPKCGMGCGASMVRRRRTVPSCPPPIWHTIGTRRVSPSI
jgi:crotonobetainyl-CoA:carnitine CoA-transferase CaiB-like acyl-CoA transferase